MTIQELDRLVSKTEMTPVTKAALRVVRKSTIKGRCSGPFMSDYKWSVLVEDFGGNGARFSFSLKRAGTDGNNAAPTGA